MAGIDTINNFLVSVQGDKIIVMNPTGAPMDKATALRLAAWLVVLADRNGEFVKVLEAVENT